VSERTFKYRVEIDTSDVARATAEVRTAFAKSMNQVAIGGAVASPSSGKGGLGDPIKAIMGFSIAGYGLTQLGQLGMQLGQLGGANLRTQKSFEGLAAGANMVADSLMNRLRNATQNTVTSQRLMASSNMLLLSAQTGQIQTTEKQIETLAKFARLRGTQLGVGTEEAYTRLVYGITKREVELIDELAISPKSIAQALGVSVQNINKDTNAFYQGIIKVAEAELAKAGDLPLDEAAKMEQASNQLAEAWDKLAIASAKPVSFVLTWTAQGVESGGDLFDFVKEELKHITDEPRRGMRDVLHSRDITPTVFGQFVPPGTEISSETQAMIDAYEQLGEARNAAFATLPDTGQGRGAELGKLNDEITKLGDAYLELSQMRDTGIFDADALELVDASFHGIVAGIQSGRIELGDLNAQVAVLLGLLQSVETAAGNFGPQLRAQMAGFTPFAQIPMTQWKEQTRVNQVVAGDVPIGEMTEAERNYRLAVGDTTEKLAIYQYTVDNLTTSSEDALGVMQKIAGLKGQLESQQEQDAQEIRDKRNAITQARLGLSLAQTDAGGQVALLEAYRQTLAEGSAEDIGVQERIAGLQSRMIEDSRQEWKRTAQEVERNFEAAASKIMSIPGVTSLTSVTGQDTLDTRYGAYQDKPDEWVRRVRDELTTFNRTTNTDQYGNVSETLTPRKTRDYADVSREQVEALTGMPAGTPHDVMIPRLEQMWTSGSLFADKANLGLMNMDAIRGQYGDLKAGQAGRNNQRQYIMEQLGIGAADASLLAGTQAPVVQMLTGGQSNDEIAAQMEGLGTTITDRILAPLQSGGIVKGLAAGWAVDVKDNIALLYGPIDSLAGAVNGRLNEKIGSGLKIVDIVVARVLAEIADDL
jgi:DNA-binding CsgD family transcriptional regulator